MAGEIVGDLFFVATCSPQPQRARPRGNSRVAGNLVFAGTLGDENELCSASRGWVCGRWP